jgi:hypothetical protein
MYVASRLRHEKDTTSDSPGGFATVSCGVPRRIVVFVNVRVSWGMYACKSFLRSFCPPVLILQRPSLPAFLFSLIRLLVPWGADQLFPFWACHHQASPPTKLPAFYLLDAMSKNVFEPYARLFTPVVVRLFLDTYEVVDQATRLKMEEMLGTWRTGAPTGRQLFGIVAQQAIERDIWGSQPTQSVVCRSSSIPRRCMRSLRRQQNPRPSSGAISTSQVLSELEFVLNNKERALQMNPYDKQTYDHVQVLQQVRV